jgi:hypothetical protein
MNEPEIDDILVAMLPLTPERGEPKPLTLRYNSSTEEGTFLYDASPVLMDCSIENLHSVRGSRNHQSRSVEKFKNQESIPCGSLPLWLRCPESFPRLGVTKFYFDSTKRQKFWRQVMYVIERETAYHDTTYDTEKITLLFNLLKGKGKLTLHYAHEVED